MLLTAAALGGFLLLLVTTAPRLLAAAAWPSRFPAGALLLWQAIGLVMGLLSIEVAATVALAPAGATHGDALRSLPGAALPWWSYAALAVAAALLVRLFSVLVISSARTLRARRRNRRLVDLVATRNPLLASIRVVDHDVPVAYCLPGLRHRVVVSRGVLDLLREDEVRAVLAHEAAHVEQRHDLVILPFVALGATFPWLSGVRTAQEQVALLIEMLADDRAGRRHPRAVLARALAKIGGATVPDGALGATSDGVLLRAQRLLGPELPLGALGRLGVLGLTGSVLVVPVLGVLGPLSLAAG